MYSNASPPVMPTLSTEVIHGVPNAPSLSGRRVSLRAVRDTDYDFLYQLAVDEEMGFRWRHRGETPGPEAFHQALWNGVLVQFVICDRRTGDPVGHAFAYNANFRYQTCFIAMGVKPSLVGSGWSIEAGRMFIDYLFAMWPFRKIYAEVGEFNFPQFASGTGTAFEVEGRLRDHEFYGNRYWDLFVLALYRERYEHSRKRRSPARTSRDAHADEPATE